jgi:hypothetical protein
MSPLAPNCEWMVTPGFCFLNAASSAVNGVDSVPAPNTISVPCAPGVLLLAVPGEVELLAQPAASARTSPAAATPLRRDLRLMPASCCTTTDRCRS